MRTWKIFFIIIVLIFFGRFSINAQTKSSVFDAPSDSLFSNVFWYNCQTMQSTDLGMLEEACEKEASKRCLFNLAMARELKAIFDSQPFVNGLDPTMYAPYIEKLLILGKEAHEEGLYDIQMSVFQCIQFVYQYGLGEDGENVIKIGDAGIEYYNNLTKEQQETIKTAIWMLSEFYYNNLLIRSYQEEYDLAKTYYEGALYWGEQAYRKSKTPQLNVIRYARPLLEIGDNYAQLGQLDSAILYIDKGIVEAKKQQHAQMLLALYSSKATTYLYKENYQEGLEAYLEMKNIAKEMDWHQGMLGALCGIVNVTEMLRQHEKARAYKAEILELYRKNSEIPLESRMDVLRKITELLEYKGQWDSVIVYAQEHLEIAKSYEIPSEIFDAHIILHKSYAQIGDSTNADLHYAEASKWINLINPNIIVGTGTFLYMAKYALDKEDYPTAIKYMKKALPLAQKINNTVGVHNIFVGLCDSYIKLNEMDSVAKYFDLAETTKSAFIAVHQDSIVFSLQEKYETKEKEQEIVRLNEKNKFTEQLNLLYIGSTVLVLIILLLVIYLYRKQKQTSKELQELQYTKDQLFSIIAHDLRTPFSALIGVSENLSKHLEEQNLQELESSLLSIRDSSSNAYFLFEDLLGWTKAQTGQLLFAPKTISLESSIKESLGVLRSMIEFKNIRVETKLAYNWVRADAYMLNTIFRNLITNAIKFLNVNGMLEISSKQQGNFILIEIRDNGIGMDKKTLQNLLEKKGERQGLGMLLYKDFVLKNGGEIGIESTLGQGTVAWFTLPIAYPEQENKSSVAVEYNAGSITQYDLPSLSLEEKQTLQTVLSELVDLKIFYASEIYRVLEKIEVQNNKNIKDWMIMIDKSIKTIDENLYLQLLEQIKIK